MTKKAYDIRTKDKFYQKKLEQQFGVAMTEEDELFYQNNCFGSYTFTCLGTVSRKWSKQKKRVDRRLSSVEKKTQLLDDHQTARKVTHPASSEYLDSNKTDPSDTDPEFELFTMNLDEPNLPSPVTRQKSDFQLPSTSMACSSAPDPCSFPKMKVRTGRRTADEWIKRVHEINVKE